jgi:hypothetical protein
MQLLIGTVSLAMGQITSFMSIFVIIISGFTLANLLAFGGELAPYRSYEFTLYTLYRSLLGADYFDEMYEVNRFLGPVLFIAWTLIGFFLLLNMFVAILNDAIDEVKVVYSRPGRLIQLYRSAISTCTSVDAHV